MLVVRATEIRDMRAEKGKQMGADSVAKLLDVKTRIDAALSMLSDLTVADEPTGEYMPWLGAQSVLATSERLLGR